MRRTQNPGRCRLRMRSSGKLNTSANILTLIMIIIIMARNMSRIILMEKPISIRIRILIRTLTFIHMGEG